jgi:predicted site-specific integrase-resolvase
MKKETLFENILGSSDVQEILCIKRVRLKEFVDEGRLKPIKALKRELLFWKPDVEKLKREMMKDKRTNLYKQEGEKKHA